MAKKKTQQRENPGRPPMVEHKCKCNRCGKFVKVLVTKTIGEKRVVRCPHCGENYHMTQPQFDRMADESTLRHR